MEVKRKSDKSMRRRTREGRQLRSKNMNLPGGRTNSPTNSISPVARLAIQLRIKAKEKVPLKYNKKGIKQGVFQVNKRKKGGERKSC